ncbi:MAG: acetyl-CoA carboxylase biotin carboxyl carrier protein subunit [Eubacterium sp.]|jgi:biotin carboxyl carrier protein|nr:acetyl-CoA carboxylase biotin carboxyl carrier protein subunit [Eubacterium sp.]
MKNYTITVNGNVYDVTVEENTGGAVSAASAPTAKPQAAPVSAASQGNTGSGNAAGKGSVDITAGAAGKVVDVVASAGAAVKAGDPVVVMEMMKMETPVVAPVDGVIVSIEVSKGQSVEAGAVMATMNE